jgi:hypothetical protein
MHDHRVSKSTRDELLNALRRCYKLASTAESVVFQRPSSKIVRVKSSNFSNEVNH